MPGRADIYTRITDEIVAAIETGVATYRMPWHHDGSSIARPRNVASAKPYRGANVIILWAAAQRAGYSSGLWGTYRQWAQLGAQVRKGERATCIVFWRVSGSGETEPEAEEPGPHRGRCFARGYSVFNAAQVDGYDPPAPALLAESARIAEAEAFYAALEIPTVHAGSEAFYRPSTDTVHVPPFAAFRDGASHYSTLFHEAVHATAAPHRCDRDLSGRFGSEAYAFEELIAETGSAMLLADLGIAVHPRPDHAAYIASWLKVLRNDSSAILTAASRAQAAVDWMHARHAPSLPAAA